MQKQTSFRPTLPRINAFEALRTGWFWNVILFPFLATRLAWVVVAAFARATFLPNPTWVENIERGGQLTRFFLLDIFAHWDAGFYMSIIRDGYAAPANLTAQYSNVAFFPLYPYLVKSIGWLGLKLPNGYYVLVGLALSNLCFLAAMALLYQLATRYLRLSDPAASRALMLIIAFPVSFVFSCFQTESLFLFLSAAAFTLAFERRWAWAAVCAALAALTRSPGIFVALAVGWIYMDARCWKITEIRLDVFWLALAPAALAGHLYSLYRLTGSWLAPFTAMVAWGRSQYSWMEGIWLNVSGPGLDVFKIDAALTVVFLVVGIALLFTYPSKVWGIYTLCLVLMPLSSGIIISMARYLSVVFPVFLFLGDKLERKEAYQLTLIIGFALQVVYFAGWVNFYWIA